MSEAPAEAQPEDRRKRTIWLLSGGAASLLLPLAGLAYIHWTDTRPVPGPGGAADVFEHHEGQGPLTPSQITPNVVSLPAKGASPKPVSSLDFIKSDPEFAARTAAAPPSGVQAAAQAPAENAASASTATATAATAPAKKGAAAKKNFAMPKLQPGRGFTSFGSGGGAQNGAAGAAGGQNTQQMLQNLPPGAANDPQVQKYLQSQQGH